MLQENHHNSLKKIILNKKGKLLSKKILKAKSKIDLKCSKGHVWKTTYSHIKTGTWCPHCAGRHKTIEDFIKLAKKRRGKCLSKKYISANKYLIWQCKKKHNWKAKPSNIINGKWCPYCAGKYKTIKIFKEIAKKNNGICLSKNYLGAKKSIKFKCKKNHIWETFPRTVEKGKWCPYCAGEKISLEHVKEVALKKNGRCLSNNKNINSNTILKFSCEFGHNWKTYVKNFLYSNAGCPKCFLRKKREKQFNILLQKVKQNEGRCLTKNFINYSTKLKFRCKFGHEWSSLYKNIVHNKKSWCPYCSGKLMDPKKVLEIIKNKGGIFLSKSKKINSNSIIKLKCKIGHVWEVKAKNIVFSKSWCQKCAREVRKPTIKYLKSLAEKQGGKLLSKKYINNLNKLKWKCANGHIFFSQYSSVQNGKWCGNCRKLTIKEIHNRARRRGGECLQNKIFKRISVSRIRWKCADGHIFKMTPNEVLLGHWCPKCRINYSEEICRTTFEQIFKTRFDFGYPPWLKSSKGYQMQLDGYSKKYKIAFEYQGMQHYKITHYSKSSEYLSSRKKDDKIKRVLCKKNKILLFIITYKNNLENLPKIIESKKNLLPTTLKKLNFNKRINYDKVFKHKSKMLPLKKIVEKRGGVILSKFYSSKMKLRCINGHVWKVDPGNIIKRNQWCRKCWILSFKNTYDDKIASRVTTTTQQQTQNHDP